MNREVEAQVGEWQTLRKGVFERESTFPDGKTLTERKFMDGIVSSRSIEEYPGVKRIVRATNIAFLLRSGGTQSLIETLSTPIEVTFGGDSTSTSIYFKDDGSTHLVFDFDEDGATWPGRETSPFLYAKYDNSGLLGRVSVKTDEISESPLPAFDNTQDALSSLLSYVQFDSEVGFRDDDPTLLDELERFSQNPSLLIAYEALAAIAFSDLLNLIPDPQEREEASEKLERMGLQTEIFAALIVGADTTAPISPSALDEVSSGELVRNVITELVTQKQVNTETQSSRRIVIENFDPELVFEEIDCEIGRKPVKIVLRSGFSQWGQGIVSQDVELRVEKNGNDLWLQWVRRGRVEFSAVIPVQIPAADVHAIAKDQKADFRNIRNLMPVSIQKLVA